MATSIIIEIPVSKKGELKFFEVNIPKDVTLLFDTEASIMGISRIINIRRLRSKNIAGTLKLQSENTADLHYHSLITYGNTPVESLLPGYTDVSGDVVSLFATPYYENDYKPIPTIEAMDSYTLYGCYEDLLGKEMNQDVSYIISLCLWTEVKEPVKQ